MSAPIQNICKLILLFICIFGNASAQTKSTKTNKVDKSAPLSKYSYVIVDSEQNTYGYDILKNNRVLIHQPHIPAVSGNKGFATKKDAAKVAELVIQKLNKNIMPPPVTLQELKNLKIKL
jgi:hypothetical protein